MTALRISELASQSGVPPTTLRYYERVGLLTADRNAAGYRVYGDQAVERLRFIGAAKRMHLSLDSIRDLLTAWQQQPCRTVKAQLRPMVSARLAEAERGIADLGDLADGLRAGLSRLDDLPDRDQACDPSCAFLDLAPATATVTPTPTATAAAADHASGELACSLSGDDHQAQLARWHALLSTATFTDITFGVTASLGIEAVSDVAGLITAEQQCCPFLSFRLEFFGATADLTITAPELAGLPFVHALLPAGAR